MSQNEEIERIEIPIEGGDFDFDEDNILFIEELDHFDIGEEEDPEEVTAGEAGVWEEDTHQQRIALSRSRRKSAPKKPGRKRKGEVIHIPKRQPPRAAATASRVKSYQQYDTFDEEILEGVEDSEDVVEDRIQETRGEVMEDGMLGEDDSDPEVLDEDGEPSTSKTWRVFVRKDGTGMHFDWPIYMDTAVSLKEVVQFISTAASEIPKEEICDSIPQEFTNTGTFIVHFENGMILAKEEICDDGLGAWNSAQMFVRKYIIGGRDRPMATQKNDHNLKIVCEQFIHPGTDSRGDFIRRIYTGFDKDEHMIPYVVICYEWMGQPHPLTVYEDPDDEKQQHHQQQFEQMTWKKCSNPEEQVPIMARHGYDYNSAVAVLLSPQKCVSYGKSVPQYVQECITFVLDTEECGGQRALYLDGNEWQRPSGSCRFFRVTYPMNGEPGGGPSTSSSSMAETWTIERSPSNGNASNSDIQILCRRYNGRKYSQTSGFVRKIYQLKILSTCPPEVAAQLVNQNLAVVSYSYRNAALPTFIEQPDAHHGKMTSRELLGEEVEVVNGEVVFDDEDGGAEMRRLVEIMEKKKKENGQRLMDLLQRMHRLDDVCKKEGWISSNSDVQELLQIGAILETSIS